MLPMHSPGVSYPTGVHVMNTQSSIRPKLTNDVSAGNSPEMASTADDTEEHLTITIPTPDSETTGELLEVVSTAASSSAATGENVNPESNFIGAGSAASGTGQNVTDTTPSSDVKPKDREQWLGSTGSPSPAPKRENLAYGTPPTTLKQTPKDDQPVPPDNAGNNLYFYLVN